MLEAIFSIIVNSATIEVALAGALGLNLVQLYWAMKDSDNG